MLYEGAAAKFYNLTTLKSISFFMYRRFKKAVNQSGHLMDLRFKEHWETAADKKKRKAEKARLLNRIERTNDKYERKADGASEYNS